MAPIAVVALLVVSALAAIWRVRLMLLVFCGVLWVGSYLLPMRWVGWLGLKMVGWILDENGKARGEP